ncbi:antibiotic biosynthesis monooxygenase family protein, partial [Ilumatobacter sp.]|uniref:antibiotic biosynthesis monooxygenase family protein n=1 Tax=Ilumatobacter sp. TaxID=1967498 RepID=UPI003C5D0D67
MSALASTPEPPYYAVIFTTTSTADTDGYEVEAARMVELAREQPGFLGIDTARSDGVGVTVSYWASEESIT